MEEMQPFVSVVIPVYRVEKYLRESVESVLAQTFRDFEIVLVDDGSPDNCPAICDEYAAGYPFIRVVHKQNAGLGMARNTGMDAAGGKYVFFLDSDDTLREDALERLAKVVRQHPSVQVVHGRLSRFITSGKYSANLYTSEVRIVDSAKGLRRAALCSFEIYPGDEPYAFEGSSCAALYDLAFLRANDLRFHSERQYISEDFIFNFEVATKANAIAQVEDHIYRYRITQGSLTQSPNSETMSRHTHYCELIEQLMVNEGYDASVAAKYAYASACSRVRALYKYLFRSQMAFPDKMKQAFAWRQTAYFARMEKEYDPTPLSKLHRVSYKLFRSKSFKTMYVLIMIQQFMRRMKGYIGD